MNIKLIKFLAAICAGLCLLIVCEWLYAIYAQKSLLEYVQEVDNKKKIVAELPTIELAKKPESAYVDLVNRPLFIQGRKPVNKPTTAPIPVSAATENFNWSLDGVYTQKNTLYALFSRTTTKVPKDNFRKVTKDNDIDGWKLTGIHKDKVIVSQGGKQKELPLRKAKPKDPAKNAGGSLIAPPVPNQLGQPFIPNQQPDQLPEPEPVPEPELVIEPELIPDESSDPYFENSDNEQFQ